MNDLYTLDLSQQDNLQWDVPCTFGQPPTPRESHSAVLHTAENGKHPRLFIYGGMSGCRLGDVFILDVGKYCFILLKLKKQDPKLVKITREKPFVSETSLRHP